MHRWARRAGCSYCCRHALVLSLIGQSPRLVHDTLQRPQHDVLCDLNAITESRFTLGTGLDVETMFNAATQ